MTLEYMSKGCMQIVRLQNTSATHHTTAVSCFCCWLLFTCNNVSSALVVFVLVIDILFRAQSNSTIMILALFLKTELIWEHEDMGTLVKTLIIIMMLYSYFYGCIIFT